jgi:hypothetical protein
MVTNPPSPCQVHAANRGRAHQPAVPTPTVEVATPASTEPTVSTLTTAAPTNDNKSEEEEDKELPPLKSVFDCKHLQLRTVNDGKHGWECGWCGKIFSPRHASRALQHVLKINKGNIAPCKATIPDRYCKRYLALLDSGKRQIESKKHLNQSIDESVAPQQESAVGNLLKNRGGVVVSGSALTTSSVSPFSSSAAGTSTISARGSHSMPFALSLQRAMLTMNLDIRKSNNATVEMAIAHFFHCKNIPDAVVESPRFVRLVRVCHFVGDGFVVPHRKKIGGELLDLNYANIYQQNKEELLKFAQVFGLTFLGDGATIH